MYKQLTRNGHHMCQACTIPKKTGAKLEAGHRCHRLVVLSHKRGARYARARCDCGTEKDVNAETIRAGAVKSCGCANLEALADRALEPMSPGFRSHRLVVIEHVRGNELVAVRCDCGTMRALPATNVRNRIVKSCGCLKADIARERFREMSKGQVGDAHPNWQGGISCERSRVGSTRAYKEWRRRVLNRDGWACTKCGGQKRLQVHHLDNFRDYPELRMVDGNGAALCKSCHLELHSIFGRYTTAKDYRRYIAGEWGSSDE